MWRSFAFRLTLTYIGLFLLSVVLMLSLVWYVGIHRPEQQLKAAVAREFTLLEQVYVADGEAELTEALARRAATRADRLAFHVFIAPDGQLLSGNLPSFPRQRRAEWVTIEADRYTDGGEFDHFALARDVVFANGARLIVGRDAEDIEELRENLTRSLLWVLAGSLLLGTGVALIMGRAIRRRLDTISGTAQRVMEGDLGQRIPINGTDDEFDRVSSILNDMLMRIETSVAAVGRVSDHVAHELRTPLTRLTAVVGELRGNASEAQRAQLARLDEELLRLNRIFDSVLRIARLESGRHDLAAGPVDLSELADEIVDLYRPTAEHGRVHLVLAASSGRRVVLGDRSMIAQALANVIDNALKYGGAGCCITVRVDALEAAVAMKVSNTGSSFAADEIAHVTERFFRGADSSNQRGEGLGLSVAAAIMAAHQGRLLVDNDQGRATVTLTFPKLD